MSNSVVLWNAKEAQEHCEQFVRDYAKMRQDLLDHYDHKGHVALRYEDSWEGFYQYCQERLRLESKLDTIKLQINAAQVSREVGVDVPMVISRQLGKLPPEKQKGVYDEVIGARIVAGQRSANQMEPDVRKVVRRELGVVEPAPRITDSIPAEHQDDDKYALIAPPSVGTDTPEDIREALMNDLGPETTVYTVQVSAQEPRTDNFGAETANRTPYPPITAREQYLAARAILCEFLYAYRDSNQEALLAIYGRVKLFLAAN